MNRKIAYLAAALLFPVSIFLFLKFFGRNQFDVPPLFQDPVTMPDCANVREFPYVLTDSARQLLGIHGGDAYTIVSFIRKADDAAAFSRQMKRVEETFAGEPLAISWIREAETENFGEILRCVALLENPNSVVLVDDKGTIRGQYDGSSLEDVDRMIVELKIMFNRY